MRVLRLGELRGTPTEHLLKIALQCNFVCHVTLQLIHEVALASVTLGVDFGHCFSTVLFDGDFRLARLSNL